MVQTSPFRVPFPQNRSDGSACEKCNRGDAVKKQNTENGAIFSCHRAHSCHFQMIAFLANPNIDPKVSHLFRLRTGARIDWLAVMVRRGSECVSALIMDSYPQTSDVFPFHPANTSNVALKLQDKPHVCTDFKASKTIIFSSNLILIYTCYSEQIKRRKCTLVHASYQRFHVSLCNPSAWNNTFADHWRPP